MRWSLPFLLSSLPLGALAGKRKLHSRQCSTQQSLLNSSTAAKSKPGRPYTLRNFYQGESFLSQDDQNGWTFFTKSDPTHGNVNYLPRDEARQKGLAYVRKDGATILAVDDKTQLRPGQNRDSVRLFSNKLFDNGLFIADILQVPSGCGLWPAYWSLGAPVDWPGAGEIDILEGVNDQATNQMTLHTSPGCSLPQTANSLKSKMTSSNCASSGSDNRGCGFSDNSEQSYGKNFNAGGGGVFAHTLDENGITIWRFDRSSIPSDITAKTPNPSNWPSPVAHFPSTNCDIKSHFFGHSLVVDTTFCGDWAGDGGAYRFSKCPGTCAEIVANPANFKNAQWAINYISVYQ